MTDLLIYGDNLSGRRSCGTRCRSESRIRSSMSSVTGVKHIAIGSMEIPRLKVLGLFELHPGEEYGPGTT